MPEDESGYIVVETIGAFMLFVLLLASILSLIQITAAQSRVRYALTQTALELSMYCYVLDAMGLSGHIMKLDADAAATQGRIDTVQESFENAQEGLAAALGGLGALKDNPLELENLNAVLDGVDMTTKAAGAGGAVLKEAASDPKKTFVYLARYALDAGKNAAVSEFLVRPLMSKHLADASRGADERLEAGGVSGGLDGLDFKVRLVDSQGDISIVANYQIEYSFGALPLPFAKLDVSQTAKTRAWFGSGTGYSG
jgi:hypothetical protein